MEPDHIRASDADRDRIAARLREAMVEGRIDQVELDDRLDLVYRARTVGELPPIIADLPLADSTPEHPVGMTVSSEEARRLASRSKGSETIAALFGAAERKGRWLVEPHTSASVMFGGIELDLREAVLTRHEVTIQCAVVFGALDIVVPRGVRVVNEVHAVLGGVTLRKVETGTDPSMPVIRLTGTCLMGAIDVKAKRPKKRCRRDGAAPG
ncbi:DUF1707 SHOCT-like domain-containing protein [Nocardiopsis ansamitocini]|uniref:Cell wall-active antibiotics response LiaF-like C-terminal domain-containing protein n=1 Tax=Nocardiopsis ansamitocini TaxID=1670832 RepID=A0A9W6P4L0_9ACTN|nr:DUF1707 domain-containing protein [Nocardiopsis ansamitocini]GLU47230.1 hypothetical protein Nans01_15810 [Nocardiopsis ansamitocini]